MCPLLQNDYVYYNMHITVLVCNFPSRPTCFTIHTFITTANTQPFQPVQAVRSIYFCSPTVCIGIRCTYLYNATEDVDRGGDFSSGENNSIHAHRTAAPPRKDLTDSHRNAAVYRKSETLNYGGEGAEVLGWGTVVSASVVGRRGGTLDGSVRR